VIRFIVTGAGQSGTHYTAAVLQALGVDAGHETVFDRWTPGYDTMPDIHRPGADGDVSYIAAAFGEQLADSDLDVIQVLQVRPPVDQIRSTLGRGHINPAGRPLPWVRFIDHHIGLFSWPAGPERAAAYWLGWTRLALQYSDAIWRLHDKASYSAGVHDLLRAMGKEASQLAIVEAMDSVPDDLGHKARADFDLDDLKATTRAQVVATARDLEVPLSAEESR
jgi:hypothetical protein